MMKQLLMLVLVTACLGQRETRVFTITRTLYSDKSTEVVTQTVNRRRSQIYR